MASQFASKSFAFSLLVSIAVAVALPGMAESNDEPTFATPQAAVDALVSAVKGGSTEGIVAVLGPDGRKLASSGDPIVDANARERFVSAYEEAHELKQEAETRFILILGRDEFPFPIPVVEQSGAFRFDTAAGAEEIIARRIGENELAAIKVVKTYVDAQREYADVDRDGRGPQYARRLLSSEGKQDGLYWPSAEGGSDSPLGPLVANARAEGYRKNSEKPQPFHGYLFRILTSQGKDAPGGAIDYVVNGRMIGGFGLVAAPAQYGSSGIMTLVVNQDGIVYEKDLGSRSPAIFEAMRAFNPDSTWTKVKAD